MDPVDHKKTELDHEAGQNQSKAEVPDSGLSFEAVLSELFPTIPAIDALDLGGPLGRIRFELGLNRPIDPVFFNEFCEIVQIPLPPVLHRSFLGAESVGTNLSERLCIAVELFDRERDRWVAPSPKIYESKDQDRLTTQADLGGSKKLQTAVFAGQAHSFSDRVAESFTVPVKTVFVSKPGTSVGLDLYYIFKSAEVPTSLVDRLMETVSWPPKRGGEVFSVGRQALDHALSQIYLANGLRLSAEERPSIIRIDRDPTNPLAIMVQYELPSVKGEQTVLATDKFAAALADGRLVFEKMLNASIATRPLA